MDRVSEKFTKEPSPVLHKGESQFIRPHQTGEGEHGLLIEGLDISLTTQLLLKPDQKVRAQPLQAPNGGREATVVVPDYILNSIVRRRRCWGSPYTSLLNATPVLLHPLGWEKLEALAWRVVSHERPVCSVYSHEAGVRIIFFFSKEGGIRREEV